MTDAKIKTEKFSRKPFSVQAIRVTPENIEQVADWCRGEILTDPRGKTYIKVNVLRALKPSQTTGYVGDWIAYAGTGFKVFSDKAFRDMFEADEGKSETKPSEVVDQNDVVQALVKETLTEVVRGLIGVVREHQNSSERG